jgi:GTP-binding protein of the ras superfamily involved in termination of M-phase
MLPLVCNEAAAILFMFDLSRKVTLASVKEWYRQARGFNKAAVPFMIGTKFDAFQELSEEEQDDITKQARKYAKLMKAPLLYCSSKDSVNIPKIFKVVLAKCFDLNCNLPTVSGPGLPIFEY